MTRAPTDRERVERYSALRRVERAAAAEGNAADKTYVILCAADDMLGAFSRERLSAKPPALDGLGELDAYSAAYFADLIERTRSRASAADRDTRFAGCHESIVRIRSRVPHLATTNRPLLFIGERGTGKGQLMRHVASTWSKSRALLTVSLAALSETLAESELFGHAKGAFTDARTSRDGLIATAAKDRGAIYLDDVAECPPIIQAKLLTCLDDGIFRPVGSDKTISVGRENNRKFSVFSSAQPGAVGRLRPDLLDRLAGELVEIPPLGVRGLDVLLLADFALDMHSDDAAGRLRLSVESRRRLLAAEWPGNVRQLFNVIARAISHSGGGRISREAVEAALAEEHRLAYYRRAGEAGARSWGETGAAFPTMAEVQEQHIQEAISRVGGNLTQAARLLGMHRSSLHKRIRRRSQ